MIDSAAALLALRNRALTLVAVTTGLTDLVATTTGYTRAAGSFITDGFKAGMEVVPTGFTELTPAVISQVAAGTLTILGGRTAESTGSNRSLVVGIPSFRAWENISQTPPLDRWYVDEEFVPGGSELLGQRSGGDVIETGTYRLRFFGLANYGDLALMKVTDAAKALFSPATALTAGSDKVRVRSDQGPFCSQALPLGNGRTYRALVVPWWTETVNQIAA